VVSYDGIAGTEGSGHADRLLLLQMMMVLLLLVMVVLLLVLLIGPGERLDGRYGRRERRIRLEPVRDALGDHVFQVYRMFSATG